MTKKASTPALRFKGFTYTWKQRKLGELGTITTGNTPSTAVAEYYSDDGMVWVTPTDISENITYEAEKKLSKLGQQVGRVVPKNTILVTCIASIGKNTMLGNTGSFNQQINGLTPNENKYEPYFLLTESALWSAQMKKSAAAGTMQIVNRTEFSELKTWTTTLAEQKQIGSYFRNLDRLITLHQRKYDKLTNMKKSMLEKMFPKNGANVPEIRFKGFTYTWEQRKLGEILQEHNTRTSDFESNPLYSLTIESGITPKTDRYERSSLVTKTEDLFKVVKPNEFVTNPMNLRFGALGYNKNAFDISVSGYYDVFSIDDDKCSGFWNSYFKTPTAMNIFDNAATGSLIEKRRVKYSALQQLVFYMPRDLSEKAEIGKYMDTLDHLITLHQRELEKLKNLKKACLEKMFV
ncbi:restriction endonuclease subunit S [Porcipelethomonas sp.]|uniref:restriction endonuclease subunit S n=1 Tax=Porcipelethomonas sp. TaxID=2981675 RepID=UPI003077EE1E